MAETGDGESECARNFLGVGEDCVDGVVAHLCFFGVGEVEEKNYGGIELGESAGRRDVFWFFLPMYNTLSLL